MHLVLSTLEFRWYVFFFWAVGFYALSRALGLSGALLRFLLGYGVAYFFEWSSSRPGGWFPFGYYRYLPTTTGKEIWIGSLPLMDSLSFSFLAVGALGVMSLLSGRTLQDTLFLPWKSYWKNLLGAGALFMIIDMVIDPVALRGQRWFLGQIYDYPGGGAYFGVTLSNFLGWFVTALVLMLLWKLLPMLPPVEQIPRGSVRPWTMLLDRFLPPFLYGAVFFFNFFVAIYLREWGIVSADLGLAALIAIVALIGSKRSIQL